MSGTTAPFAGLAPLPQLAWSLPDLRDDPTMCLRCRAAQMLCGKPVCPECGSHDVVQVSRVTGYLQDVSGWNAGKQQELKDRTRYSVA